MESVLSDGRGLAVENPRIVIVVCTYDGSQINHVGSEIQSVPSGLTFVSSSVSTLGETEPIFEVVAEGVMFGRLVRLLSRLFEPRHILRQELV